MVGPRPTAMEESSSFIAAQVRTGVSQDKLRVLIVEDDQTYEPFWRTLILGINPETTIDWVFSEEAAERYLLKGFQTGHAYDLVILDILLAGDATGLELWGRFKEASNQFLFVSNLPKSKFEDSLLKEDPPPLFLEKPLNAKKCTDILRTLLYEGSHHGTESK